ncbi:MAG: peptidoglycan-associated outer membrane lipoprotein precursor [Proteobacteria bacterium]|nr:peptidoglycan-associated outer membrane lipoprotein precursor [Pseudomonadota bacterium]
MNKPLCILGLAASVALAGCASTSPGYGSGYGGGYGNAPSSSRCHDCGTILAIEQATASQGGNIIGPVVGGIVGAVAAKELARKNTDSDGRRNVAIAAGAAGGAVAGNAIQNRVEGSRAGYNIHVRMDDGRTTVIHQNDVGGLRKGSYVRVQDGYVRAY